MVLDADPAIQFLLTLLRVVGGHGFRITDAAAQQQESLAVSAGVADWNELLSRDGLVKKIGGSGLVIPGMS